VLERLRSLADRRVSVQTNDATFHGFVVGPVSESAVNIVLGETADAPRSDGTVIAVDGIIEVHEAPHSNTQG
jgi:hypothetical protein